MRASTVVHLGIRNIGDAASNGDFFHGPLQDGLLWMMTQIAQISLAKTIVIAIGRTKEDVAARLDLKRGTPTLKMMEFNEMLAAAFADSPSDSSAERANGPIEGDTYAESQAQSGSGSNPADDYQP